MNWAKFPSLVFVIPGCLLSYLVLGSSLNCWETSQATFRYLLSPLTSHNTSVINHCSVSWYNGLLAISTLWLGQTLRLPFLSQMEDSFLDFFQSCTSLTTWTGLSLLITGSQNWAVILSVISAGEILVGLWVPSGNYRGALFDWQQPLSRTVLRELWAWLGRKHCPQPSSLYLVWTRQLRFVEEGSVVS